jgi:hypothetical protein
MSTNICLDEVPEAGQEIVMGLLRSQLSIVSVDETHISRGHVPESTMNKMEGKADGDRFPCIPGTMVLLVMTLGIAAAHAP